MFHGFCERKHEGKPQLTLPYYPDGEGEESEKYYPGTMKGEKLVMDYCRLSIWEVQDLDIDVYLYFMREAYIAALKRTKEGREYLVNCWRMTQTKPDRKMLREQFGKKEQGLNG